MKLIQSRDNPTFKHLRSLAEDGRYRREVGATLLDGAHLLQAATAAGMLIQRVVLTTKALGIAEVVRLIETALPERCELIEMPEALLRQISPVETPSGLVAEMRIPAAATERAAGDILLLESVQDAGNLGTLLRTAAAAGIRRVLLSEQCAQAWSPKVLRAGMGAQFSLHIEEACDLELALADWPGAVIATALEERSQDLFALDLKASVAWMFGSEGRGLSAALLLRASHLARIPMPGGMESLNVAAAAAICLFEQVRQRQLC